MSEEKLYAVKNDEGKYFDCEYAEFLSLSDAHGPTIVSEDNAKDIARDYGGHVVALVEEPEKVVLSKEEARIVEDAHDNKFPADYITGNSDHEKLLMEAFVNGYTVAKEKKYNVKVPHLPLYYWKKPDGGIGGDDLNADDDDDTGDFEFTEAEIKHYGLQDCEKEEVTDDEQ